MLTNYVSCEECIYKDVCHQFDAFFGCDCGKPKLNDAQLLLNKEEEKSRVLIHKE